MKRANLMFAILALLSINVFAETPNLEWSTIDSGGGQSSGGLFSLGGTIGQPDAGYHTGGAVTQPFGAFEFDHMGGFWSIFNIDTAPQITSILEGKHNVGDSFSYQITAQGTYPIVYEALYLPPGLTLNGDTISGTILNSGLSTIKLLARNGAGSDAKFLVLTFVLVGGSHPNTPKIISAPIALPNPVVAGTEVQFQVTATDVDGDILSYYWDFGDQTTSRDPNPVHTYSTPGNYLVKLSVSDGKHFPFTQFNVSVVAPAATAQLITKVSLNFDFVKPSKSTLVMQGFAIAPQPLETGTRALLSVGPNLARDYELNSKGVGGDSRNLISLKTSAGGKSSNNAKLTVHLKNPADDNDPHTLFSELEMLGFVKTKTPPGGITVNFPVSLKLVPPGTTPEAASEQAASVKLTYKTVPNKSGKGKK